MTRPSESEQRSSDPDDPAHMPRDDPAHMPRVIETVARLAKVSAGSIRHGRGGPLRMLCAWLGWYEGWHRLGLIAASLRLRSSGHISDLIEACERQLSHDTRLNRILDLALPALRV